MKPFTIEDFVRESNRIEGIDGFEVHQVDATRRFLMLESVAVANMQNLVEAFQPGAILREMRGCDVRVGPHLPPRGGPEIRANLGLFLEGVSGRTNWTPWRAHCYYETLHPFTDGNGRSGRALWLWMMGGIDRAPLGFLHTFYYQTLQETRK